MMTEISYSGYHFPSEIIQQAIWLYVRFTLSFRDVEDLLAERGITVSYETVRRWVNHFGPKIAADLRKRRPKPHTTWHLDEVYLKIDGRLVYLWRAVDAEREVLDVLVQTRRNKHAALKLMCKLLKKYGYAQAQQARLRRDQCFRHPTALAVRAAISGGPPVNAGDLRAVVMDELRQLRAELHTTDTMPWKRYWNFDSNGKVARPRIENECRDHLLDRLRDRLQKYRIAAAVPEARRGEDTRADMLILTEAGRNLPVEAKRHFHEDIWNAASTQLQGYTADPGADGFGIYLVFWFGNDANPTPARPGGGLGPISAIELEAMLVSDLAPELRARTDVLVFDVSDPAAAGVKKPRQKRRATAQPKSKARSPSAGVPVA
jgi:hypothetical protein